MTLHQAFEDSRNKVKRYLSENNYPNVKIRISIKWKQLEYFYIETEDFGINNGCGIVQMNPINELPLYAIFDNNWDNIVSISTTSII